MTSLNTTSLVQQPPNQYPRSLAPYLDFGCLDKGPGRQGRRGTFRIDRDVMNTLAANENRAVRLDLQAAHAFRDVVVVGTDAAFHGPNDLFVGIVVGDAAEAIEMHIGIVGTEGWK